MAAPAPPTATDAPEQGVVAGPSFGDKAGAFLSKLNPFSDDADGKGMVFSLYYSDFWKILLFYAVLYVSLGLFYWALHAIAIAVKDPRVPK